MSLQVTFIYKHREVITCYHELTPWAVNRKKWDTKEDKGKKVSAGAYIERMYCSMPKGTSQAEVT